MTREQRDREQLAIAKAVLADATNRNVLSADGVAIRRTYSTVLPGNVPAEVELSSCLPTPPAGDHPPEAYLKFRLWPKEPRPRPRGYFNVVFRKEQGWMLYGDFNYQSVRTRSANIEKLVAGASERSRA